MAEYIKKTDYQITLKDKLTAAAAVLFLVFTYFKFFHTDKTPQGYVNYSDEIVSFLRDSDDYKNAYASGKKLVIYNTENASKKWPYPQEVIDQINELAKNKQYSANYEFLILKKLRNTVLFDKEKGEATVKAHNELKKQCRRLCVINPKKQQLYFFYDPNATTAENLPKILETLEFWGIKIEPQK